MACFGWPFDARLIRSVALSLRHREFTRHAVFAGMSARKIMFEEHLPYVMPIVFSTAMANMIWSIGLSVTLAVLGFTDINVPTIGTMLYWANNHSAMVVGTWWWIAVPGRPDRHHLHRSLPARGVAQRVHRSTLTSAANGQLMTAATEDVLTVTSLKAYYRTKYFGVEREVRAVDDITLSVRKNEIYGIAGESSSGKTTLIKTFAAAIRPPLRIVGGSMTYHFKNGDIDPYAATKAEVDALRWKHLSYIMQGSMSLLNPVRRVRRTFEDFAFRPMGLPSSEFWGRVEAHLQRLGLSARRPVRLSAPAVRRDAPAGDDRPGHRVPARVRHRRRADHRARRGGAEGRAGDDPRCAAPDGVVRGVRHPRHERARQHRRPRRHHVCGPARGGGADAHALCRATASLHRPSGRRPATHRRHHAQSRRSRDDRPTSPNRPRAAASTLDARSPSTSARPRCRHSSRSGWIIARACWRSADVPPLLARPDPRPSAGARCRGATQ